MIADDLAAARTAVETTLTDACTVTDDPGGYYNDTFNTTTGELTPSAVTTVYTGTCSFRTFPGDQPAPSDQGGQVLGRLRYRVTLPFDGTQTVAPGHVITCTDSDDSSLIGKTFTIRHVLEGAWEPSRRCDVEDRISGFRLQ